MTIEEFKNKLRFFATYDVPKLQGDCEIEHGINYFVETLLKEINIINFTDLNNNIIFGDFVSIDKYSAKVLLKEGTNGRL